MSKADDTTNNNIIKVSLKKILTDMENMKNSEHGDQYLLHVRLPHRHMCSICNDNETGFYSKKQLVEHKRKEHSY
jgi:hypothetical protein